MAAKTVFVAGGSGYMGRRMIARLLERGHTVRAMARRGSESRLPVGCDAVIGDALRGESYDGVLRAGETFVHLVGVAHPGPAKAAEFKTIDLASIQASAPAAARAGITHFVYVSVGQPAPVMKAYQAVRAEGERLLRESGMNCTVLRPWYVLGPGHRWPYALLPFYWICERLPATREGARRLGLVTLDEMVGALVHAVENPARGFEVFPVPAIRANGRKMLPADSRR
ncbi:MAG TPA: NAD(P)H-binding protein [Terriglobales bacterium]|nr:NAD(P)H-binding protein [Terriglobales bacterium]